MCIRDSHIHVHVHASAHELDYTVLAIPTVVFLKGRDLSGSKHFFLMTIISVCLLLNPHFGLLCGPHVAKHLQLNCLANDVIWKIVRWPQWAKVSLVARELCA